MPGPRFDLVLEHARRWATKADASNFSDRRLVDAFLHRRDQDSFTALVQRHGPMVLGVCQRLLRDPADVEDAFQAAFFVLARKAGSIRKVNSIGSWLHGVARRLAHKCRVAQARRSVHERESSRQEMFEPSDAITWNELRGVLDDELAKMDGMFRAPLVLCFLEGRTQDEAARQLGLSKRTLRRRLERGRERLRNRLTRRGISLSAGLTATWLTESSSSATVPSSLASTTAKAAIGFLDNVAVQSTLTPRVAELSKEMLRTMSFSTVRVASFCLLLTGLLGLGGGLIAFHAMDSSENLDEAQPDPIQSTNTAMAVRPNAEGRDRFGDPLPSNVVARLGTMRLRHGGGPYAAAYSPDGKRLASVSSTDNTIRIWDALDGKELLRIEEGLSKHPGALLGSGLFAVAFSPNGKTLATAMPVRLWDATTGKLLHEIGDQKGHLPWVTFSPDGELLAYGCREWQTLEQKSRVTFADTSTGEDVRRLSTPEGGLCNCAAFSPDGRTLAACMGGTAIHRWNVDTGVELPVLRGHGKTIRSLVFTGDGKTLISGGADQTIRFWDLSKGTEIRKLSFLEKDSPRTIRPDGKSESTGPVLALSHDGTLLASGHVRKVRFWDVAQGKELKVFDVEGYPIYTLSLSADGKTLATAGVRDGSVRLWEVPTGKALLKYDAPRNQLQGVVLSADGRLIATGGYDDDIRIWDAATGAELNAFPSKGRSAFSPDGATLVGGGWNDGIIHVWDVVTGRESRTIKADEKAVYHLAVSPDGKKLLTAWHAGATHLVRYWDLASGMELGTFGGPRTSWAAQIIFGPRGDTFASLHPEEQLLRLWDIGSGNELHRMVCSQGRVSTMDYSANGKLLAAGGYDGTLYVWDAVSGKNISQGKIGEILDEIAFTPDSRSIVWGCQKEKTIHIWEIRSRQERCRLDGHHGMITGLALAADGSRLVSGSNDGTGLVWDLTGDHDADARKSPAPDQQELEQLFKDLGADAATAYRAILRFQRSPQPTAALFGKRLQPVPHVDGKAMAKLLADLDSATFATREQAAAELAKLGPGAEPALKRLLVTQPGSELRHRVNELLAKLEPARLAMARAIEVLERLHTREARQLLLDLAHGAPGAWLTQEAAMAVERLERHKL